MIKDHDEANKYYSLINGYVDDYISKWKIKPKNLFRYLSNSEKLKRFLERRGLYDVTNIRIVLKDVLSDRVAMEKDMVMQFESHASEFKFQSISDCIYRGIENSSVIHEKILADHFDVSLSHIDVADSPRHFFKIHDGEELDVICYSEGELESISANICEFYIQKAKSTKVCISENICLEMDDFIDDGKLEKSIGKLVSKEMVIEVIESATNSKSQSNPRAFIGIKNM